MADSAKLDGDLNIQGPGLPSGDLEWPKRLVGGVCGIGFGLHRLHPPIGTSLGYIPGKRKPSTSVGKKMIGCGLESSGSV
jgi:hypothetical protein